MGSPSIEELKCCLKVRIKYLALDESCHLMHVNSVEDLAYPSRSDISTMKLISLKWK